MEAAPPRRPLCAGLVCLAILAGGAGAMAEEATVERGRFVAEALCARCHAVGAQDESAHADAPAFRTLSERYPVAHLQEALGEGIVVGHDMPEIALDPQDVGAFIAYLEAIQAP